MKQFPRGPRPRPWPKIAARRAGAAPAARTVRGRGRACHPTSTSDEAHRWRVPGDGTDGHFAGARDRCARGQAPVPAEFVIPGETLAGAAIDLARTSVRRAERRVVALAAGSGLPDSQVVPYLQPPGGPPIRGRPRGRWGFRPVRKPRVESASPRPATRLPAGMAPRQTGPWRGALTREPSDELCRDQPRHGRDGQDLRHHHDAELKAAIAAADKAHRYLVEVDHGREARGPHSPGQQTAPSAARSWQVHRARNGQADWAGLGEVDFAAAIC